MATERDRLAQTCPSKFQSSAKSIEMIKELLMQRTSAANLTALSLISEDLVRDFTDHLLELSSNWNAQVRTRALNLLQQADPELLVDVIRDGLRDPHPSVRKAAALLFHAQ